MSIPRKARRLLRRRDAVMRDLDKGQISSQEAAARLGSMRVVEDGTVWSVRPDLLQPRLVRTAANGETRIVAEGASWLRRWWPAIPLVALSLLALWGFATSTAEEDREIAPGVSVTIDEEGR